MRGAWSSVTALTNRRAASDHIPRFGAVAVTRAQRAALHEHLRRSAFAATLTRGDAANVRRGPAGYGRALERLTEAERLLVVAHVELGYNYEQIAAAAGYKTTARARAAVVRTFIRLAQEMSS